MNTMPNKDADFDRVAFSQDVQEVQSWFTSSRFEEISRLYSAQQIVEQRGSIIADYSIARQSAILFFHRLQELFGQKGQMTTFGPYSPGQAVAMKRAGIEGIYLGGWATSAKGSVNEDPGPDLASYPLSQVPDEAASIVRALLAADKNQQFARSRLAEGEKALAPAVNFLPFMVADADTGHGGEAHVRNLIRRFVEVGVPGYHIEDQKPGCKKCGHQGGKVLVPQDEQIKRLNAARFQLDLMGVPGIIVARTDAEAATLLDGKGDERDQPFILGAIKAGMPSYKISYLSIIKRCFEQGVIDLNGHLLYRIPEYEFQDCYDWLGSLGVLGQIDHLIGDFLKKENASSGRLLDQVVSLFHEVWESEACLRTYPEAVAEVLTFRIEEGHDFEFSVEEWLSFAKKASLKEATEKAMNMGLSIQWDCELPKTPEGFYQIRGGIEYAIEKSLAVAPYADLIWMETKTANLEYAKRFADAIHAVYPNKMLAYNLSPSFNWDTTGMSEDEMRVYPRELGKLGYVFNFITYGGHQIDGMAAQDFATALQEDGMLALARLQRKFRLLDSPYRTPQTLVGGPRIDSALMATTGRTATTRAMGKGSTQSQHMVQTEVPPKLLESWVDNWKEYHQITESLDVQLRPHTAGSELLELDVISEDKMKIACIVFTTIQDRRGRMFISMRDQQTFKEEYQRKRLMMLMHLFLIHRYEAQAIHYVSPNENNTMEVQRLKEIGLFSKAQTEIGQIIVAQVNHEYVKHFIENQDVALDRLIHKEPAF